jgi:tetratricopeptide (TPR) repeat protein
MDSRQYTKGILLVLALLFLLTQVTADTSFDIALTWAQKGDLFFSEGQYQQALESYNTSVTLDPYNPIAWNKFGETQSQLGDYRGALHSYSEAVRIDPYFGNAWVNQGDALQQTGKTQDALTSYNRAISINPNDMHAFINKGLLLKSMGNQVDAQNAFNEVLKISDRELRVHPNDAKYDADLWDYRALAFGELGRYQEALQSYDQALAINPKHPDAIRNKRILLDKLDTTGNLSIVKSSPPITTAVTKPPTKSVPMPVYLPLFVLITVAIWQWYIKKPRT